MTSKSPIRCYRELKFWQDAMALVKAVYKLVEDFPKSELYSLTHQMRRAAISIPSNIAEGQARDSTKEFIHHIAFAMGSLAELETQLELGVELGFASRERVQNILQNTDELGRMLRGLQRTLRTRLTNPTSH